MTPRSTESAIGLPPAEAIEFLRQKTNTPTAKWGEVWDEAHSRAFTVAGATSQALLTDFRGAVAKALEQGTTLAEFRADFDSIVAKHGWTHHGSAAWRAQLIYETNLSMAYSAGRYAQMTEPGNLEVYPYWQYQHTSSAHPRPQHLAWVGTTLRYDDPWWASHYPPNGWRCRCSVRPVTGAALRRQGKTGPDTAPPIKTEPFTIRATGRVVQVPDGIDPGFGYNPGAAWRGEPPPASGAPRAPQLPPAPTAPAAPIAPPGQPAPTSAIPPASGRTIDEKLDRLRERRTGLRPRLPNADAPSQADSAGEIQRLLRNPETAAIPIEVGTLREDIPAMIGATTDRVVLSPETVRKQLDKHGDLAVADYALIPRILANPDAVYSDRAKHAVLLRADGKLWRLVIKATKSGEAVFVASFRRASARDAARAGVMLETKPEDLVDDPDEE